MSPSRQLACRPGHGCESRSRRQRRVAPATRRGAFSLTEITIALGIMAFCLVALFGLLPVGLKSNQTALEQTAAASIATSIVSDLRTTPQTVPPTDQTSPRFQIDIPASGTVMHSLFFREDGSPAGSLDTNADPNSNPRYRATMVFTVPPTNGLNGRATMVRLLVTWPAMADSAFAALPANSSGSFETVIALDRN